MESKQQSASIKTPRSRASLAGSLVRTLLVFTFIPLLLMAGAAYFRARALLRGQVVNQMQTQLTSQIDQANVIVKTKEIRLDRVVRTQNFANDIDTALHVAPQSEEFKMAREELAREANKATFSQYFLMKPDSTILIASNSGWEGVSLGNASYYQALNESDRQSFTLYDIPSLYPGQLVLVTVAQYPAAGGSRLGTFVGITESQSLQEILQSLTSINPSANAYFVTQSGVYIGTDPYTSQLTAFQPSDSQNAGLGRVLDEMMSDALGAPRSLEFNARDGQPVLAQAKWLTFMKTGVVLELPQRQVVGQLNTLIPFTIAIFLISLLAMAGVIWLGTNRVFRPLVSLAEITQRYSEGDFGQRAEVRSQDEIGLLATSFNRMAEDLNELYRSLEQKVEERTRQIRTAAEVAQRITSTSNLDELLNRTVQLIVEQFSFYQASIFMLDRSAKFALLHASYGPAAKEMLARGHRLEIGSASIIGWVSANNQPRIASDVAEDPIHLKNELLPETRSEAGIPISVGNLVLGALDVQSAQAGAFGPETIVMLQTLASQLAVAIQNVGLVESTQVNFQELERLYRAGRQITSARTEAEALQTAVRLLEDAPYPAVILSIKDGRLGPEAVTDLDDIDRLPSAIRILSH